jgi:hypothetical protein
MLAGRHIVIAMEAVSHTQLIELLKATLNPQQRIEAERELATV